MRSHRQETLKLPVRYYQGWPAINPRGLVEEILELPVAQTGFVELHCWNSGFAEGPALPVDRWAIHYGVPQGVEGGCDALVRDIVQDRIGPAMAAARAAGLPIFHVQPRYIAEKHPQSQYMLEPDAGEDTALSREEPIPGWRKLWMEKVAGVGVQEWEGRSEMDIAPPLKPQEGDYVIITGPQFDRVLRHLGVVNLIYTGFHVNWCIIFSPASMREMAVRYGYRTVLLRDCTLAVESHDTLPRRELTKWGIRCVEQQFGFTATAEDFIRAIKA
jgi:nicotinamidase-related amidase